MKALLAILMLSAVLFSCGNEEVKDDPGLPKENPGHEGGDFRSRAVRHVEAQLNIAGTERYGLSIIKQHLDGDDKEGRAFALGILNFYLLYMNSST